LFTGDAAPQTDVTVTFDRSRISVVRGRIVDRDGNALAGVLVSAPAHPDYGHTASRADGGFDLAVEGGSTVTLRFDATGRISAQRHVVAPWRRFAVVNTVTLVAYAPSVAVTVGAQGTVVDGASSQDASGTRASALYFAPGTRATIDGGAVLTSFHVHTTEFTVGDHGPSAMPADLPATSGYTYAVDFAVDEAAGAKHVSFDPPVLHYVDNFLQFPVGTVVPNGYYDADRDVWQPGANGLVVQVLADNALAVDGSGTAASPAQLAALGITADELAAIARRYPVGKIVWRVPIAHFSAWDHNWPFGPPADATAPDAIELEPYEPDSCKTTSAGSIIGCDDQSLGEVIAIPGSSLALHYQSERVDGRLDANRVSIQLSGPTVPASLVRIDAEVEALGVVTDQSFPAAANQSWTFDWDGKDGFGRTWQGRQTAHVRVGFVYAGSYQQTTSFGGYGTATITGDRTRQQVTIWKEWDTHVGKVAATGGIGIGGWTLGPVHAFDAAGGMLALGDGRTRVAEDIGSVINTVTTANAVLWGMAFAADGTAYVSANDNRIYTVASDGTMTPFAGTGVKGFSGDGASALAAQFDSPMALAVGADGTVYVADLANDRVRAISPSGIVSTFAGGGACCDAGDGGPATSAFLGVVLNLAVGPDGCVYIADGFRHAIRRVAPDGTISTVAGGGTGVGSDGDRATSIDIQPHDIRVGTNQHLYIADWSTGGRVLDVAPDGTFTTVIGLGTGSSVDGSPARTAAIQFPYSLDVARDGSMDTFEVGSGTIRRITTDGRVQTVAGGGLETNGTDNIPPLQAAFSGEVVVRFHPDGTMWVADADNDMVRRIRPALPDFSLGESAIASESGDALYIFDNHGRHLRTVDSLTRAMRATFGYDAAMRLVSITDVDGNITSIERDAAGSPTAIVSPRGERTTIGLDAAGNLASVTDLAGETIAMTYAPGGLLATLVEPRGDKHLFSYDALGRLAADTSPTGLTKSLARDPARVTMTGPGGATTIHTATHDDTATTRTFRDEAGLTSTLSVNLSATTAVTPSQSATATYAADPRFGMQSAYPASVTIDQGAHHMTVTRARSVTLATAGDPLSLQELVETVSVNGAAQRRTWDATSRTLTVTSAEGRTRTSSFDDRGHVVQTRLGSLAPIAYSYDAHGLVASIAQGGRTRTFARDATGRISAATDALGLVTATARDAGGRVIGLTVPDGADYAIGYDSDGNTTALTSPSRARIDIAYGGGNVPTTTTGAVTASKTYDGAGRVTSFVRPDGSTVALGYDTAGRIASVGYPGDSRTIAYDATTGHVAALAAVHEHLGFGYDGDLLSSLHWTGDVAATYAREFDDDFAVIADTAGGARITYGHDGDEMLTAAGDLSIVHDDNGLVASTSVGAVTDSWTYNAFGEPIGYAVHGPNGTSFSTTVSRDADGRIVQRTETVGATTHGDAFGFDARGRLISQTRDGTAIGAWSWDGDGNRTSGGAVYDAKGQLVAIAGLSLAYDGNGALVQRGPVTFGYDATGALVSAKLANGHVVNYVVDPTGRRVGKRVDGVMAMELVWADRLRPAAQLDGSGALVSRFVYGTHANVPDYLVRGGHTYRLVCDLQNSVRLVVDVATGAVAEQLTYDVWGTVVADSNPGFQPFGFAGGLYDPDTGLVRFGARDYDPVAGRFTTRDPSGLAGGLNGYAYANGDPIDFVDPDGHLAELLLGPIVGAVIGGGIELYHQLDTRACVDWGEVGTHALAGAAWGFAVSAVFAPEMLPFFEELVGGIGTDGFAVGGAFHEGVTPAVNFDYNPHTGALEVFVGASAGVEGGVADASGQVGVKVSYSAEGLDVALAAAVDVTVDLGGQRVGLGGSGTLWLDGDAELDSGLIDKWTRH